MIKKVQAILALIALISFISCATEEVIFDIDQQFEEDLTAIDQFLATNNIVAEIAESGVRYRIQEAGGAMATPPSSQCGFTVRMTVHYLDSTYIVSNYPEIEALNGFDIPFDEEYYIARCAVARELEGLYLLDELVGFGGKVQFFVPSRLGWGTAGRVLSAVSSRTLGGRLILIPQNQNLLITAELIDAP